MIRISGSWIWRWACGALVALLLVAIGYGVRSLQEGASPLLGGTHLHAATASQNEAYAMATGAIDEEVEGVYLLNFLTGDLQCSVMGIRTGRFAGMFKANVIRDLGMDPAKQPAYLMATGRVSFARGAGAARQALSVVYVLDTTSGRFAAYSLPWRRDMANTGRVQAGALVTLDVGQGPTAITRE